MNPTRRPSTLTAFIALILATSGPSVAAQDRPIFRSTAEIARVEVAVFRSDGTPVTALEKDDFVLRENGERRPLPIFVAPSGAPMELALVLDTSGSMGNRGPVREAAWRLLGSLNPRSCVLLVAFDTEVRMAEWGHPRDARLRETLAAVRFDRGTAIYDGLLGALQLLRSRGMHGSVVAEPKATLFKFRGAPMSGKPPIAAKGDCSIPFNPWASREERESVRQGMVVITDGQDAESDATLDEVLLAAWGVGVPLYALTVLQLPSGGPLNGVGRPTQMGVLRGMGRIAEHTGGFVIRGGMYRSGSDQAFLEDVARLQAALQGLYTLGYVPAPADEAGQIVERRKIEVEVNRDDVEVITTENLALGRGRSAGAALHLARQGMRRLAEGDVGGALERFDGATSLGPEVGMGWFGRGLALVELDRPDEAVDSLRRAAEHAPWIPDVHAHLARLYLDEGDTDAAWESAIKAYDNGSDVLVLIDELQAVDPRPFDPGRIPEHPRVELRIGGDSNLLGAVTAPALAAALANELDASDRVDYGAAGDRALILEVDISDAEQRGPRVELDGWLVLTRSDGDGLIEQRFRIRDANDREELATLAREFVARIEAVVEERRRQ